MTPFKNVTSFQKLSKAMWNSLTWQHCGKPKSKNYSVRSNPELSEVGQRPSHSRQLTTRGNTILVEDGERRGLLYDGLATPGINVSAYFLGNFHRLPKLTKGSIQKISACRFTATFAGLFRQFLTCTCGNTAVGPGFTEWNLDPNNL